MKLYDRRENLVRKHVTPPVRYREFVYEVH